MVKKKAESVEKVEPKTEVEPKAKTEADLLWDKIKNLPLDLFGLPDQEVSQHCKRLDIVPNAIHLQLKAGAVLPALEEALKKVRIDKNKQFDITPTGPYIVVSLVPKY